ncbi:MAG: PAS domain S-box protein [Bacteroidales bacterium]|nr:PAS domain S-box protein [Bacteroidales bacterium]
MRKEQNRTILLVEDEVLIAMSEKMQLEEIGYNVLLAHTGENSIELFVKNTKIDLVLMDINLGNGIDGVEAGQLILNNREVPLVFLSSHTEPEVVMKTEKITSYGYVVKNSGLTVLDASIQMAFKLFYANKKVYENEQRYRTLFNNSHTTIFLIDPYTKKIADVNQAALDFYGWSYEEFIGKDISEINSQYVELTDLEIENILKVKQKVYEFEHRIKNGSIKYVEVRTGPINISNKILLYSIIIDRTAKKIVEELLNKSEIKYQTILNTIRESIFIIDVETFLITEVNDSACKLYGYLREELIGLENYKLSTEPDLSITVSDEFKDIINLKKYIGNRYHKRKDGTTFPVIISSSLFEIKDKRYVLAAVSEIIE